jgi:hypothetical protein
MLGFLCSGGRVGANSRPILQVSDDKVIEIKRFPNEPYRIGDLRVKNTEIVARQPFSAGSLTSMTGDWLENLEFTVRNTSDRRITYIVIQIDFPETGVGAPMMVYPKGIGIPPAPPVPPRSRPLSLDPGDKTSIIITAPELEGIKDFLATRNYQLADLNKVVIRIATVAFDDGIKWEQGRLYRRSPGARSGYEEIKQEN